MSLIILAFVLAAGVIVALAVLAWRLEKKRREALAALAERLGLAFSPAHSHALATEHRALRGLDTGEDRYAFNVLQGMHNGRQVTLFDFHYETTSADSEGRRSTSHHHLHVILLHLERALPALFVAPEDIFSKIAQAFGYDDIDFESHEFSRRFCVRSADRKFAYDFCNARMIDLLLAHPRLRLETRDGVLAMVSDGLMNLSRIESELDLLHSVRDRMPDYLFAAA